MGKANEAQNLNLTNSLPLEAQAEEELRKSFIRILSGVQVQIIDGFAEGLIESNADALMELFTTWHNRLVEAAVKEAEVIQHAINEFEKEFVLLESAQPAGKEE